MTEEPPDDNDAEHKRRLWWVSAAQGPCSGFPFASCSRWSPPSSGLRSTSPSRPPFDVHRERRARHRGPSILRVQHDQGYHCVI